MKLQVPSNNGGSSSQEPKTDLESSENEKTEQTHEPHVPQSSLFEEIDSTCSTPFVSAPSSPGRGSGPVNGGFYYSAPASPMHFALTASYPRVMSSSSSPDNSSSSVALGFEFGSGSSANGSSMSSADELFLDGKIRPMKLSSHLERPQVLAPLLDLDEQEDDEEDESAEEITSSSRGRDHIRVVLRDKSMRRRTRSLSPLRSTSLKWNEESAFVIDDAKESKSSDSCLGNNKDMGKNEAGCEIHNHDNNNNESSDTAVAAAASASPSLSASTSRSSSAGRSTSKRWVFLKDFLYRSKSEGRSNNKFWSTISFSPVHKEKKLPTSTTCSSSSNPSCSSSSSSSKENTTSESVASQRGKGNNGHHHQVKKPVNGIGKRRVPPSPHELHYTANRAQAVEMRKKTFLPYRQGLLGCLGFSSKGYGAMNGFARALNPVSSR